MTLGEKSQIKGTYILTDQISYNELIIMTQITLAPIQFKFISRGRSIKKCKAREKTKCEVIYTILGIFFKNIDPKGRARRQ